MEIPDNFADLIRNPQLLREGFEMLRALKNAHVVKDGVKYPLQFSPHNAIVDISKHQGAVPTTGTVITPPPPTGTTMLVNHGTLGAARSDFTGCVGMKFIVGATPRTVYSLGRLKIAGNAGNETMSLHDNVGTLLGSTVVDMGTGGAGSFIYNTLATPVSLLNGVTYHLWMSTTNGGNQWSDLTPITLVADFIQPSASFSATCSTPSLDQDNKSYGLVDMLYV